MNYQLSWRGDTYTIPEKYYLWSTRGRPWWALVWWCYISTPRQRMRALIRKHDDHMTVEDRALFNKERQKVRAQVKKHRQAMRAARKVRRSTDNVKFLQKLRENSWFVVGAPTDVVIDCPQGKSYTAFVEMTDQKVLSIMESQ